MRRNYYRKLSVYYDAENVRFIGILAHPKKCLLYNFDNLICFEYYIQYLVGNPNKSITFVDYIESIIEIF